MKIICALALACMVATGYAQHAPKKAATPTPYIQPSWLPSTCQVGDVSDSYDGDWHMCAKENHWTRYKDGYSRICEGWSSGGWGCGIASSPECRLYFRDEDGNGHCPWESATGRVVACSPCPASVNDAKSCQTWYSECLAFLDLEKRYLTAEPTPVDLSKPRADHVTNYECPDDWASHWIHKTHEGNAPICVKDRPKGKQ